MTRDSTYEQLRNLLSLTGGLNNDGTINYSSDFISTDLSSKIAKLQEEDCIVSEDDGESTEATLHFVDDPTTELTNSESVFELETVLHRLTSFQHDFANFVRTMPDVPVDSLQTELSQAINALNLHIRHHPQRYNVVKPIHRRRSSATLVYANELQQLQLPDFSATNPNNLQNHGVKLLKSPSSIKQLWAEYTTIPENASRTLSIQGLEQVYGSTWRSQDRNFSRQVNRRKKIWNAIEDGLNAGIPLEACFEKLENYLKREGKCVSWFYGGVPDGIML